MTPADPDDTSLLSPVAPTSDKPITATEQQIKARAELGVSVDVSTYTALPAYTFSINMIWRELYAMLQGIMSRMPNADGISVRTTSSLAL
jgi:hypothetical protein